MIGTQNNSYNMTRRNAPAAKIIAAAVFIMGTVYFLYLLKDTNGKLKDTERVANRYRREQEALSAQLADLRSEKENLQNRCDNERKEYQTRLSSANQQYKMLQSQNEDLQSEFTRLREDFNKDKEDHKLHDAQQNQEYMQLKQEKDLEIASLKDEVANIKREKTNLNEELLKLKTELEASQRQVNSYEMSVNSLQEQNRALETQIGTLRQNLLQQQQQQAQIQQQGQQQQQQNIQQQQPVNNFKNAANQVIGNIPNAANQIIGNIPNVANQMVGNIQQAANNLAGGDLVKNLGQQANQIFQKNQDAAVLNMDQQNKDNQKTLEEKNKLIDEQQQQHQVMPPNNEEKLNKNLQVKPGETSLSTGKPKELPNIPQINDGQRQVPPPRPIVNDESKNRNVGDSKNIKKGALHPEEVNQQQNIPPPNVGKNSKEKSKLESVLKGDLHPAEREQQQNIPPPRIKADSLIGGELQQQNLPPPKRGQRIVDESVRFGEPLKLSDIIKGDGVKQPAMPDM